MPDYLTQTARLIPYTKRPKAATGFVTAYLFEPTPGESGSDLGSLYIAMEVISGGREAEEVVDLTIDTLGTRYYNSEHTGDVMSRFETAIKATNRELADYINNGNASWVGKMSAVAAILQGDDLHIAQTGSAEAYLYRSGKASRITAPPANRIQQPSKIFGSIVSGTLEISDTILLTTPALIHQLPLDVLKETVSENPPNVAIGKFTELLGESESAARVAALVIRLTTPELAAQSMRSDSPSDIAMANNGSFMDNAKATAAPLTAAAMDTGRKVGSAAKTSGRRYLPMLRAAAIRVVSWLRNTLANNRGRQVAGGVVGVVVIGIIFAIILGSNNHNLQKLTIEFENLAKQEMAANLNLANGNKDAARTTLNAIQPQAVALSKNSSHAALDKRLKKAALPEGEATSLAGLLSAISNSLNAVDGIVTANATTVVDLTTANKGAKPALVELVGSHAIVIDSANNSAIYQVDLASGTTHVSSANTAPLGTIVATTPAAGGDGVYILTAAPAVWLYRPSTDTLTQELITADKWPAATSIASYLTNLYLLGQNTVYKSLPTIAGFTPKTTYLDSANASGLTGSTALAVDGSIYVASPTGVYRYLAGALTASTPLPHGLGAANHLQSVSDGTLLTYTDTKDGRFGLFTLGQTTMTFLEQYQLSGPPLKAASYDPATKTIYALTGTKLVKFNVNF